jgi:hypothetical protein
MARRGRDQVGPPARRSISNRTGLPSAERPEDADGDRRMAGEGREQHAAAGATAGDVVEQVAGRADDRVVGPGWQGRSLGPESAAEERRCPTRHSSCSAPPPPNSRLAMRLDAS